MLAAALFSCAILAGFFIGAAELGFAGTVLVGFAVIGALVVVGLALELLRGPRGRVHLSRG
jgi:hypothetical protein